MTDHVRISIVLTVTQVNQVLSALGRQPHDDVHALIYAIKEQADSSVRSAHEQAIQSAVDARMATKG